MPKRKPPKFEDRKIILLIDGDGLLHQSFHKFKDLKSIDGIPTGAIFGFFKSLQAYLFRFTPDDIVIVFDNGHSKHREEILPEYKEHRKRIDIDYSSLKTQKKKIMHFLRLLNIKYVYDRKKETNYEGDDFIAYLTLKWAPRYSRIVIISADKDFNQLLDGMRVRIYNPRKDIIIYESNCHVFFGYRSCQTVDYLTLVGDDSDDIPGYAGIGHKKALSFLEKYGSISAYLSRDEYLRDDMEHEKMNEVYNRNRSLIDLKWFINMYKLDKLPIRIPKDPKLKIESIKRFAIKHSLGSFMTDLFLSKFTNQFKRTYVRKTR